MSNRSRKEHTSSCKGNRNIVLIRKGGKVVTYKKRYEKQDTVRARELSKRTRRAYDDIYNRELREAYGR